MISVSNKFRMMSVLVALAMLISIAGVSLAVATTTTVTLQEGTATFSQELHCCNLNVDEAVDGQVYDYGASGTYNGWAIFDNGTTDQTAVWETASDVNASRLDFALYHTWDASHSLGRFRLSYTTDDRSTFADGLNSYGDVTANWTVFTGATISGTGGETFTVLGDNSILVSGNNPATTVYSVSFEGSFNGITGIRLEALSDVSLPDNGPGRGGNGNFHLVEITLDAFAPGAIAHFDATTLAQLNGETVITWGGQTAAGTPTFLTNQTPGGGPAVQFNGGGDRMGNNIPLAPSAAGDWIVVAVIKPNNIGYYHNLVDDDASNRPMLWIDPGFNYELNFTGGSGAKSAGTGTGGWDIVIADSRLNQLYVNSPTPNASGRSAISFAAAESFDFFHRDSGQTFQGLVAELRIYNDRADFGGDFAAVYGEMYAKWIQQAPTAAAGGPYNGDEGSVIAMSGATAADPDMDMLTYAWTVDSAACSFDDASILNPNLTCTDNGSFTATLEVSDGSETVSSDAIVTVNNVDPTVTTLSATPILENGTTTLSGVIGDVGSLDTFTLEIDWDNDTVVDETHTGLAAGAFSYMHQYLDDDPTATAVDNMSISVTVTDDDTGSVTESTTVEVTNVDPIIDAAITGPVDPVAIDNQTFAIGVTFSDAGASDTHDVTWGWGDGTSDTQMGVVSPASAGHQYADPGVYKVTVTVTDDDGGTVTDAFEYVVVYDPNAGFVTGGGWINSPAGAYTADPSLTGKANFGFVAKYRHGQSVPDGNTQFQFKAGNLNFHSTSYEWLVVAGARAKFRGVGTINGQGTYTFMITATDGNLLGGGQSDGFRIKIWDAGGVVYDNKMGEGDDSNATTDLGGGSIVIHNR